MEIEDLKPFDQRSKPTFTHSNGTKVLGELLDEVYVDSQVIDEHTKGIVYRYLVQKIRLEDDNEIFRFCYYSINFDDDDPKWTFRKNALMALEHEIKELLNKMIEKGWIQPTIMF